jgi:hypothetical protein
MRRDLPILHSAWRWSFSLPSLEVGTHRSGVRSEKIGRIESSGAQLGTTAIGRVSRVNEPLREGRHAASYRRFLVRTLVVLVLTSCGTAGPNAAPVSIQVRYHVQLNAGNPERIVTSYLSPAGETVSATVTGKAWSSPSLTFEKGDRLQVSARSSGDINTEVQCQILTTSVRDADGTVHGSLSGRDCLVRVRAGAESLDAG